MFIGVCGSSSSGKTTISELLKAKYENQNNKCFIISLDMFYKNTSDYSIEDREYKEYCLSSENMSKPLGEREIFNFDKPELLDMNYAREVLIDIANGKKEITMPVYNYGTKPNSTKTVIIDDDVNIIIVEGIFLFYELDKHLQNLFDYLIFVEVVDTFPDMKSESDGNGMLRYFSNHKQDEIQIFLRRFYRDKRYRKDHFGYIEFLYIWENIMKSYRKYIEPYKHLANLVINNNKSLEDISIKLVIEEINKFLCF